MTPASQTRLFPYPKPRRHTWDHSTRVLRWMGRNSLRLLRQHELAGVAFPGTDELAAWIIESHPLAAAHFDADKLSMMAGDAAAFALDAYDPEFYRRAARGGAASAEARRKPVSDADLLRTAGWTHAAAAAELGVSVSTIRSRRRERGTVSEPEVLIPLHETSTTLKAQLPSDWRAESERILREDLGFDREADLAERLRDFDLFEGVEL